MDKPSIKLSGEDGNVFNLIGIASRAIEASGQADKADEMTTKIFGCSSYDEALRIISEYCKIY